MRFTSAYVMFILYTLLIFRQVMPVISDVLSHTFAEAIHIATIHAKYGSNHLQKEVADTDSDSNKPHNTAKTEETTGTHVSVNEYRYCLYISNPGKTYSFLPLQQIAAVFISRQGPPPKFSC